MAILICFATATAQQQSNEQPLTSGPNHYAGAGIGFDYGGIGVKVELLPVKYVGVFVAGGYNLDAMGFNVGVSGKLLPDCMVSPAIIGMYGYNAVIRIDSYSGPVEAKTYYGFSLGAGAECKLGRKKNKMSMYVLYPFRTSKFHNDYDGWKNRGVSLNMSDVTVSLGYNFAIW